MSEAWRDYPAIREHLEMLGGKYEKEEEEERKAPLWVAVCFVPYFCLIVALLLFVAFLRGSENE